MDGAMRELTRAEANVLNYIINHGSFDNPVTADALRFKFDYSERAIKEIAENLRTNGHPVVARKSKPNGYFVPKTEEERQAGLRAYKKQIATSQNNVNAVEAVDLGKYWKEVVNG